MTDRCPHCYAEMLTDSHKDWCQFTTGVPATLSQIPETRPDFDGPGYVREYDLERLTTQKEKIFEVMKAGAWRTLGNISHLTGSPEASASAMLRAFRQARHGGHTVNRRRRGDPTQGWHEYQLIVKPKPPEQLGLL